MRDTKYSQLAKIQDKTSIACIGTAGWKMKKMLREEVAVDLAKAAK